MKKWISLVLIAALAVSAAAFSAVAETEDPSDRPTTSAERINNIDLVGTRDSGFGNGDRVVTIPSRDAIEVNYSAYRVRGWSVSMEGVAGFYYQLSYQRANGTLQTYDPVPFDATVREDVLDANPDFAAANPEAKVGIDFRLDLPGMRAGTYALDIWALTSEGNRYQVLKSYIYLEVNYNVNGDDTLDVRDAIAYKQILAGSSFNSSYDYNGDGRCDEYDYQQLLYAIMDRME